MSEFQAGVVILLLLVMSVELAYIAGVLTRTARDAQRRVRLLRVQCSIHGIPLDADGACEACAIDRRFNRGA